MRMSHQFFARQLRQKNFRSGRRGAHELPAVQLHEVFAVVLVQCEARAIGRDGLSESTERFHFENAVLAT